MDRQNPRQALTGATIVLAQVGIPLVMLSSVLLLQPGQPGSVPSVTPSPSARSPEKPSDSENFQLAKNDAWKAAVLTQSANTREEWQTVVSYWQVAINRMKNILQGTDLRSQAQQKVAEYQRNLSYARQRLATSKPAPRLSTPKKAPNSQPNPPAGRLSGRPAPDPLLAASASLPSRNWVMVAIAADNQTFYVDPQSSNFNLPYVEFWQRIYAAQEGKPQRLQDQRLRANCRTRQFQVRESITYTNGRSNRQYPRTTTKATPNSAQERTIASICGQ